MFEVKFCAWVIVTFENLFVWSRSGTLALISSDSIFTEAGARGFENVQMQHCNLGERYIKRIVDFF